MGQRSLGKAREFFLAYGRAKTEQQSALHRVAVIETHEHAGDFKEW
jgi:hypothetical protein